MRRIPDSAIDEELETEDDDDAFNDPDGSLRQAHLDELNDIDEEPSTTDLESKMSIHALLEELRSLQPRITRQLQFSERSLATLGSPTSWMSDDIINSFANLFSILFADTSSVSVFSTWAYTGFTKQFSQNKKWKIRPSTFSNTLRDVWLFPIHLPKAKHWIIASVYIKEHRIDLFDSMLSVTGDEEILQVCVL